MYVIGKPIKGGHYGKPPSLAELDADGNVAHTTDFRRVGARVKSCIHTFLIRLKGFVLQKKELLAHVVPRMAAFFVQDFDLSSPCGAFKAVQIRPAEK